MAYNKTNWENLPSTNTPINATNLNKVENELEKVDTQLDINTWSSATIQSNLSGGLIQYAKIGRLVVVNIEDVQTDSDISTNATVIATGLPRPVKFQIFLLSRYNTLNVDANCRMAINTSGGIQVHYDTLYSGNNQYYGQFMYLTNE